MYSFLRPGRPSTAFTPQATKKKAEAPWSAHAPVLGVRPGRGSLQGIEDITDSIGLPGTMRLRPYRDSKELGALRFRLAAPLSSPDQALDAAMVVAQAFHEDGTPIRAYGALWDASQQNVEVIFEPEDGTTFSPFWSPQKLVPRLTALLAQASLPSLDSQVQLLKLTDPEARSMGPDGGMSALIVSSSGAPSFTKAAQTPAPRQFLLGTVFNLAMAQPWGRVSVPTPTGDYSLDLRVLGVAAVLAGAFGAWNMMRKRYRPNKVPFADGHLKAAREDLEAAKALRGSRNRLSAYHAQQAAEKIAIAAVVEHGGSTAKDHNIHSILLKVPSSDPVYQPLSFLGHLTKYATAYRYPAKDGSLHPPPKDADMDVYLRTLEKALKIAEQEYKP